MCHDQAMINGNIGSGQPAMQNARLFFSASNFLTLYRCISVDKFNGFVYMPPSQKNAEGIIFAQPAS